MLYLHHVSEVISDPCDWRTTGWMNRPMDGGTEFTLSLIGVCSKLKATYPRTPARTYTVFGVTRLQSKREMCCRNLQLSVVFSILQLATIETGFYKTRTRKYIPIHSVYETCSSLVVSEVSCDFFLQIYILTSISRHNSKQQGIIEVWWQPLTQPTPSFW